MRRGEVRWYRFTSPDKRRPVVLLTRDSAMERLRGGRHHIGTTRMAEDPTHGVVDRNCQVHGVDNLFIAGSSVFPTAGHANPTLTIVALALRLADHLKRTRFDRTVA